MGLMSKAMKLGIAKKVVDEARKPENQRRVRGMIESAKTRATKTRRHQR